MVEIDPMDLEKAVLYKGRRCICVIISIGKGCCFYKTNINSALCQAKFIFGWQEEIVMKDNMRSIKLT